jgi:hypothetical protein
MLIGSIYIIVSLGKYENEYFCKYYNLASVSLKKNPAKVQMYIINKNIHCRYRIYWNNLHKAGKPYNLKKLCGASISKGVNMIVNMIAKIG